MQLTEAVSSNVIAMLFFEIAALASSFFHADALSMSRLSFVFLSNNYDQHQIPPPLPKKNGQFADLL